MKTIHFLICLTLLASLDAQGAEAMRVTTRPLEQLVIFPSEEAPAESRSLHDALITAQVAATIQELTVQVGDRVQSGALLVRLDPWAYRLAERRANAELEGLRARLETVRKRSQRAVALQQQKQASDERVEQSASEVKELAAQIRVVETSLEEARIQADKCLVRAPFSGIVVQRPARIGVNATPGTPLVQLVNTEEVELMATLPAGRVSSFNRATSWVFQHEGGSHPVTLRALIPVVDPATRTREARFLFTDTKPVPGATGRLVWSDPRPHLPPWLVSWRDHKPGVFLVTGETARFHALPGALEGHPALLDPLPEGAAVLSGRESLKDQTAVKIIPSSP
ncbi:MAG: efflux RND transporter periplasmic adaptor subunit [Magnetococcales bacterium]|nr:efflux RND transporter periplasmic adaptor subunit [Magnetococcales bacterium]